MSSMALLGSLWAVVQGSGGMQFSRRVFSGVGPVKPPHKCPSFMAARPSIRRLMHSSPRASGVAYGLREDGSIKDALRRQLASPLVLLQACQEQRRWYLPPVNKNPEEFSPYVEIDLPTDTRIEVIRRSGLADQEWVVTEKVHGTNFGIYLIDEASVRFAKRSGIMDPNENFFGYHLLMEEMSAQIRVLAELIRQKFGVGRIGRLILNGELFGAKYKHPLVPKSTKWCVMPNGKRFPIAGVEIQREPFPQYSPELHFFAFDLKYSVSGAEQDFVLLSYDDFVELCARVPRLLYARALVRGTLDQCLAFDVENFQTPLPALLGLGNYPLEGNLAEGVVIRHCKRGSPEVEAHNVATIIKLRCSSFMELKHPGKQRELKETFFDTVRAGALRRTNGNVTMIVEAMLPQVEAAANGLLLNHVSEGRLNNVFSKIGREPLLTGAVTPDRLAVMLAKDALKDFLKDSDELVLNTALEFRKTLIRSAYWAAKELVENNWRSLLGPEAGEAQAEVDDKREHCPAFSEKLQKTKDSLLQKERKLLLLALLYFPRVIVDSRMNYGSPQCIQPRPALATPTPEAKTSLRENDGSLRALNGKSEVGKASCVLTGMTSTSSQACSARRVGCFGLRFEVRSTLNVPYSLNTSQLASERITRWVRERIDNFRRELLLAKAFRRHFGSSRMRSDDSKESGEGGGGSSTAVARLAWQVLACKERIEEASTNPAKDTKQGNGETGSVDVDVAGQIAAWLSDAAAQRQAQKAIPSRKAALPGGGREPCAAATQTDGDGEEEVSFVEAVIHRHLLHDALLNFGDYTTTVGGVVQDMLTLGEHLLVPLDMRRRAHLWLFVHEDTRYTLQDRLFHYRVMRQCHEMPAGAIRRLWQELWAVLLAAWRLRDRLWGTPVHPPKCFSEGDSAALGPMTASSIGVVLGEHFQSTELTSHRALYVLRHPLAALLRGLRVPSSVNKAETMDALAESILSCGGLGRKTSSGSEGGGSCWDTTAEVAAPLFDVRSDDMWVAMAVPYLSPECYVALRVRCAKEGAYESAEAQGEEPTIHRFSDDAWNVAVLVIEAALCGFDLGDANLCHLSPSFTQPDATNPGTPAHERRSPTYSIYADLVMCLVQHHGIAVIAAQNFLYATLEAFGRAVRRFDVQNPSGADRAAGTPKNASSPSPDPTLLAEEWLKYVELRHGKGFITGLLHEIAVTGLCWTREARWQAFHHCATAPFALKSQDIQMGSTPERKTVHVGKMKVADGVLAQSSGKGMTTTGGSPAGAGVATASVAPEAFEKARKPCLLGDKLQTHRQILHRLQTPLLPLFPEKVLQVGSLKRPPTEEREVVSAGSWLIDQVWNELLEWLRAAELEGFSRHGADNTGEARQSVRFDLLLRLIQQGILHEHLRTPSSEVDAAAANHLANDAERRNFLSAHPFFRCLTEWGQLPAYVSAAALRGSSGAPPPTPLVFLGEETVWAVLRARNAPAQRATQSDDDAYARRVGGSLQMLLGSAQERFGGAAAARGGTLKWLCRVLQTPLELNVALPLRMIAELRRRIGLAPSTAARAQSVRAYLREQHRALRTAAVPIPPTLRGEVWGALLNVPPANQRAGLYARGEAAAAAGLNAVVDRQLNADIPRCHQYHPLLASEEGHDKLRRVIKSCLCMNPALSYCQGIDSLCAVLLSVSFTDEALVAQLLLGLIRRYLPYHCSHLEGTAGSGVRYTLEEQLHQIAVYLQYCDPFLATHLFQKGGFSPWDFAVGWVLALFAHPLPARVVYPLWDHLLLYDEPRPHRLACLGCAMLLQRHAVLYSRDPADCLVEISKGGKGSSEGPEVSQLLRDATILAAAIPCGVGPLAGGETPTLKRTSRVALMRPDILLEALRRQQTGICCGKKLVGIAQGEEPWGICWGEQPAWWASGVYLVDLRGRQGHRVLGALQFPQPPTSSGAHTTTSSDAVAPFQSWVEETTAELLRQLRNPAMAALPPQPNSEEEEAALPEDGTLGVSAMALKTAQSPHVVLLTAGCDSATNPTVEDHALFTGLCAQDELATPWPNINEDLAVSEPVALELLKCGVHNVSILAGGVAGICAKAPWLVVPSKTDN